MDTQARNERRLGRVSRRVSDVRLLHKIKTHYRYGGASAHKAPQCGSFSGIQRAICFAETAFFAIYVAEK